VPPAGEGWFSDRKPARCDGFAFEILRGVQRRYHSEPGASASALTDLSLLSALLDTGRT
jgi:hypothetical protein